MMKVQLFLAIAVFGLVACQNQQKKDNQYTRRDDSAPLVDDKYSLKADRQKMDQYRGEVPAETQRENDEMALVLQLFQEVKKQPSDIRSQFDSIVRKKRASFDKDMQKEREKFTKDERAKRENFLKEQKNSRDALMKSKPTKDERENFFKEQDEKRKEFFADERDKRNDYESDVRERRKSFEDYVREKQNEFQSEYRGYTRRFDEWKREQEKAKSKPKSLAPGAAAITPASNGRVIYNNGTFTEADTPTTTSQVNPPTAAAAASNSEAEQLEKELNELKSKPGSPLKSGQ